MGRGDRAGGRGGSERRPRAAIGTQILSRLHRSTELITPANGKTLVMLLQGLFLPYTH